MQNILSFEELDSIINQILIKAKKTNNQFYDYCLLLTNTGFRPSEALEKNRIMGIVNTLFIFQPAKKNNVRHIDINVLPLSFYSYYFENSIIYQSYYYKRFQRIMRSISPASNYDVDGRKLGLYIFRYYYVRKLYMQGMTFDEITTHMGWKNNFIAFKYVTRNIIIN